MDQRSYFIEELVRLFFKNCKNDPQHFVTNFDQSDFIIAYNYRCSEHRFTDVSNSFVDILGYSKKNILSNGNFTSKILHPQDRDIINFKLNRSFLATLKSDYVADGTQIIKAKCRAKHIRGYWKYFIIYALEYRSDLISSTDKIGLLVDQRINSKQFGLSRIKDQLNNKEKNSTKLNNQSQLEYEISNSISPRENEILELIGNGLVTKEIANQLHISESTVTTHRKNLIAKLEVRNTAELIKKASRQQLI